MKYNETMKLLNDIKELNQKLYREVYIKEGEYEDLSNKYSSCSEELDKYKAKAKFYERLIAIAFTLLVGYYIVGFL